jgi:hypothetical protein
MFCCSFDRTGAQGAFHDGRQHGPRARPLYNGRQHWARGAPTGCTRHLCRCARIARTRTVRRLWWLLCACVYVPVPLCVHVCVLCVYACFLFVRAGWGGGVGESVGIAGDVAARGRGWSDEPSVDSGAEDGEEVLLRGGAAAASASTTCAIIHIHITFLSHSNHITLTSLLDACACRTPWRCTGTACRGGTRCASSTAGSSSACWVQRL